MATKRYEIVIRTVGAREAQEKIKGVGRASQTASRWVSQLKTLLTGFAAAATLRGLTNLVDTFTLIQNRLRTVTDSTAELAVVTGELIAVSNRTRSDFRNTAEVYTRAALATRELGISQRETLHFTESLNQAIILGGSNTREANQGLIQLSQGLASGALRGDELRSVLEQLPVVSDVIAQGLNVTRGELRRLGEQGLITARDILRAFRDARLELDERFTEIVPTIGQALTVLRNQFLFFIGSIDQTYTISGRLAQIIIDLANHMETFGRSVVFVSTILITIFVQKALFAAIRGMVLFTTFLATNPFTALALAITVAGAAVLSFGDRLKLSEDSAASLLDFAIVAFEELGDKVVSLGEFILTLFQGAERDAEDATTNITRSVADMIIDVGRYVDDLYVGFATAGLKIQNEFEILFTITLPRMFLNMVNYLLLQLDNLIQQTKNAFANLPSQVFGPGYGPLQNDTQGGTLTEGRNLGRIEIPDNLLADEAEARRDFVAALEMLLRDGVNTTEDALRAMIAETERRAQERLAERERNRAEREAALAGLGVAGPDNSPPGAAEQRYQRLIEQLEDENALLRVNSRERTILSEIVSFEKQLKRELTAEEARQVSQLVDLNIQLADQADVLDSLRDPMLAYEERIRSLNTLLEEGSINSRQYTDALRAARLDVLENDKTIGGGIERAILNLQEDLLDFGSLAESTFTSVFDKASQAITDFVTTGKLNFKEFARSIIADLIQIFIRIQLLQLVSTFFGGPTAKAGFNISNFLPGYATGADFTVGGKSGVDQNIVAFRATKGERVQVTPAGQSGSGGGNIVIEQTVVFNGTGNQDRAQMEEMLRRNNDQLVERIRRERQTNPNFFGGA